MGVIDQCRVVVASAFRFAEKDGENTTIGVTPEGEAVISAPAWKHKLNPDCLGEWEFCARTGDCNHYPGTQFAQLLAYYNDRAGLYLACNDTQANVKRFKVVHREPGIRLGVAHVGDWPQPGERQLEYDTIWTTLALPCALPYKRASWPRP